MTILPKRYIETLRQRDFLVLTSMTMVVQFAASFLIISLISSVYSKTGSNFGVSGVILSFAAPGLFLMAIAGLFADFFDRKKIIVLANCLISLVVFLILFSFDKIYASISLSFLYFAGNSFLLPASIAASAQLVKKRLLLYSNSIFVFSLATSQLFGFMFGAIVHFLFGELITLIACQALLVCGVFLSLLLPNMPPRSKSDVSIEGTLRSIWKTFDYIFSAKRMWFFFTVLASMQGVIAFGVTLAPGFFDEILAIPIERSLVLAFPLACVGVILGLVFLYKQSFSTNKQKIREGRFVSLGIGAIGFPSLFLGLLITFHLFPQKLLIIPVAIYLIFLGFGVIVCTIASRTILQRAISHNYLGSVFGANTILASLFAVLLAPFAAGSEALFGYVNLMLITGVFFGVFATLFFLGGNKWKF